MCIRNYIDQDNLEIRNALDAFGHKERISTDEVSSASIVSVLTAQREPQVMQWGSNCLGIKDRVFYVQSETVMDSSMFQDSIRERRCLVPVSWYLELKNIDPETEKRPPTRLPEQSSETALASWLQSTKAIRVCRAARSSRVRHSFSLTPYLAICVNMIVADTPVHVPTFL